MTDLMPILIRTVVVLVILAGLLYILNRRVMAFCEGKPHLKFRRQLIQLSGTLVAVLVAILLLPFDAETRGNLLGLLGLVVSATIALSSTTLVGNVMAGIMLKSIRSCKPGDYITVGDHFGRISEMDLLHTEIQTEQRDLTTLPNLYLVTHPVRVMRTSGTVLSVDLSLGYDVSRHEIERLLLEAATATGLESPYVQIRDLGDFSVTYAVSGLLTEINLLLAKRRELRGRTMDALHAAGIEIVSPSFMNTRAYDPASTFIPAVEVDEDAAAPETAPDAVVFDKAEKAESVSKLQEKLKDLQQRLKEREELIATSSKDETRAAAEKERDALQEQIDRLQAMIDRKSAKIMDE